MQRPPPATDEEPEELKRFREAWKAEVQYKKAQTVQSPIPSGSHDASAHAVPGPADDRPIEEAAGAQERKRSGSIASVSSSPECRNASGTQRATISRASEAGPSNEIIAEHAIVSKDLAHLGPVLRSAVDVYRRAIQYEQSGDLDEALRLYRQAFRIDDNVDKAYRKAEKLAELRQPVAAPQVVEDAISSITSTEAVIDGKALDLSALSISADIKGKQGIDAIVTGALVDLLQTFPKELGFEPEDEKRKLPITKLPDELLIHVLRYMDHTTLERFAAVSKKARVITLDSAIWRDFVHDVYNPPQVPHEKYMKAVMQQYLYDYRRAYIEQPRLRLDGVYIAVCHYVRAGLSQNAWVNISHLITYHRFLRFFPHGEVISLLANEEMEPHQVIPLLKSSLRMKGVTIGNWRLEGTTVYITDLIDPASLEPGSNRSSKRYAFQMTLSLRSRPLGRWNKLDIAAYETVNLETGETDLLPLKHERPFWFSKVRSYSAC